MQKFTIKAIHKTRSWINGIEAHLDSPAADPNMRPARLLTLVGWIASSQHPIKRIWLACRGKKIAEAKVFERDDVKQAYADRAHVLGFELNALPIALGEHEPLKLAIESSDGKRTTLFDIELEYRRAPAAPVENAPVFAPIVALPRSGTTYLAQLLHAREDVLGPDTYPYELRLAEQLVNDWFASAQPWAFAAPADRNAQTVDPNFATVCDILRNGDAAGGIGDAAVESLCESGRRLYLEKIVSLYRLAAPKPRGRVIAEKIGLGVELDLLAALAGSVRPVFLIRDPRDILLSMRSFNERRGIYEFHEPRTKLLSEVVHLTAVDLLHLTQAYDRWRGDKLLVRYEELVTEPARVLREVLEFVGVPLRAGANPLQAVEAAAIPGVHVTAATPRESIGRWRSELTPSEITLVDWHFAPFLSRFGF